MSVSDVWARSRASEVERECSFAMWAREGNRREEAEKRGGEQKKKRKSRRRTYTIHVHDRPALSNEVSVYASCVGSYDPKQSLSISIYQLQFHVPGSV